MKKRAFTLAEVLITLVIIGVVAALTIPTLTRNINDIEHKTAYKKAFAAAAQAWQRAVNDDNIVDRDSWVDAQSKLDNFNAFKSYFKIIRDCNNSNNSECWASSGEKYSGYPG